MPLYLYHGTTHGQFLLFSFLSMLSIEYAQYFQNTGILSHSLTEF